MSKNSKRREFNISARQQQVFELWKEGATIRAISEALKKKAADAGESTRGYATGTIHADLTHVLEAMGQDFDQDVQQFKTLQLARLNDQYMTFNAIAKGKIDKATGLREKPDVDAGRLVLGIIKEVSDITGVRSAVKHELSGQDGKPIEVVTNVILKFSDKNDSDDTNPPA